jgi:hypothetical protein
MDNVALDILASLRFILQNGCRGHVAIYIYIYWTCMYSTCDFSLYISTVCLGRVMDLCTRMQPIIGLVTHLVYADVVYFIWISYSLQCERS